MQRGISRSCLRAENGERVPDEIVRGKAVTVGLQTGGLRLYVGKVVVGVVAAEQPVLDRERVRPACELLERNITARPIADLHVLKYPCHMRRVYGALLVAMLVVCCVCAESGCV